MPRDDAEYAAGVAAFEAAHGKVRIRRTKRHEPVKPKPSAEEAFASAWAATGGPAPEAQFKFCSERKWTFDFAWPAQKLALELEGFGMGGGGGRHHLPAGIIKDAEKFAEAVLSGWRVLRVPSRGGKDVALWIGLVKRGLGLTSA